jgi:hypothetical protein
MKTSNPISSVKKLTIGGFTFCVFNCQGNILYFVFYANFFVLRKRKGILQFYFFSRIFNSQGNIYMLCFHVDVDFIVEI